MNRIICALLVALTLLSLVGCGDTAPQETTQTTPNTTVFETTETAIPETTAEPTTVPETTAPVTTAPVETTVPETTVHKHDYKATKVEPTCEDKGYTEYTCECGDSYCGDEVKAKGHDYKTKKVEPTETKQGYTKHTCSVCGHSYKDNYVDAIGKQEETKPAETIPAETKPQETTPPATEPAETKPQEVTPPTTVPEETKPAQTGIGNVTPETLTYEIWSSWDKETQKEFKNKYPLNTYRGATYYHYNQTVYGNGYECPGPCRCETEYQHTRWGSEVCFHCGKVGTECPSHYANVDAYGYSMPDQTFCPEYDVKKDPIMYCQTCGWPKSHEVEPDPFKCCNRYLQDTNCIHCGVWVTANTCHHCVHTAETEYCKTCGRPRSSDIEPDPFKRCHYYHSDRYCKYCGEPAVRLTCHHCKLPEE